MDQKKIAVVTGANGGIGKELIVKLEKDGYYCLKVDKGGVESEKYIPCDFTKQDHVINLAKKIFLRFKKIDILFNVAGIGIYKEIEDLDIHDWNNSISINITAPFILTKELLPKLKASEKRTVFNIGSGMGVIAHPGRAAYCTSKFGLRGLSLTLSKELKQKDVSVVHLTLGSVMTNFGTGGLNLRKSLEATGKKYLQVSDVIDKIFNILSSPIRQDEYIMYPEGYH